MRCRTLCHWTLECQCLRSVVSVIPNKAVCAVCLCILYWWVCLNIHPSMRCLVTVQLLMGDPEALLSKPRYVIPPASPGPTLGPLMPGNTSTGRRPKGSLIWCPNWFLSTPRNSAFLLSGSPYLQPLCRGTSFWPLVSASSSLLATTSSSRPQMRVRTQTRRYIESFGSK